MFGRFLSATRLIVQPRQAIAWTVSSRGTYATEVPVKPSTTLVGLPVVTNPREVIEFLANKILEELQTIPDCYYKSEVEKMARNRLKVVTEETDWRIIYQRIVPSLHVEQTIDDVE